MRITKQRLKEIILEEMNYLQQGDAPANSYQSSEEIGEISEGEGMELTQQVAQILFDTGVTAAESPEELARAIGGLVKMGVLALGGGAMGVAGVAGMDAINKIKGDSQDTEVPLEEEEVGTLEELISQAIQEELEQMTSKKA
tara:strand:+ start:1369 stop:1794 length:426 start_codon:yes stop_codon:yes gene_type:complete